MKYVQPTFSVYSCTKEKGCHKCGRTDVSYFVSSKDGFLCSVCYGKVHSNKQTVSLTPRRKLVRKGNHA